MRLGIQFQKSGIFLRGNTFYFIGSQSSRIKFLASESNKRRDHVYSNNRSERYKKYEWQVIYLIARANRSLVKVIFKIRTTHLTDSLRFIPRELSNLLD